MNRAQPPFAPLLAVLGLLLVAWLSLTQTASAVHLPLDHSDLFATSANLSKHQETDALPPKNRVWENSRRSNETGPEDQLNSLQLRWKTHFSQPELASGIPVFLNADPIGFSGGSNWFAYADGNPISLNDPFGLCAESGGGVWNTLKGAGQAQWNNLNSGAAFLSDGFVNAIISVPQGLAWTTDQAHHVLNGSWSSLGTSSYNGQITSALESMKNPYAQGNYEPGFASNLRDATINAGMIVYGATSGGVGAADDVAGGLSYHPRIRARGVEDGVGHNFPYSFDDTILSSKPVIQGDGSLLYRATGTINKTDGVFEMAVNPETGTIFHRQFRKN